MVRNIIFLIGFFGILNSKGFAQTINYSISFGGGTRTALVYLPPNYHSTASFPLVFNLHGYTSNAQQQLIYSQMNTVADAHDFIVVYPNGLNNSWNSGFTLPYQSGVDDVGFISALIDSLDEDYSINLNRVYACGMSNGGYQSYRLACDLSQRITAIASVTGLMSTITKLNCNPARTVPVMQIHGTSDAIVPIGGSTGSESAEATLNYWKQQNGCANTPVVISVPNISTSDNSTAKKRVYEPCNNGTDIWYYEIVNGGHTWPGAMDITAYGNTNKDFNASEAIWEFFSRFTLQGGTVSVEEMENYARILAYPNPLSGSFMIQNLGGKKGVLQVLDMQGRHVYSQSFGEVDELKIDAPWANGMYILNLNFGDSSERLTIMVKQ